MDSQPAHQTYHSGLEVVHYTDLPQVRTDLDHGKEIASQTSIYTKPYYATTGPDLPALPALPDAPDLPDLPAPTPWWKRRRFLIAVAVLVVVALAAALGGVLGGKKGSESQGATGETSGTSGSSRTNGTGTSDKPSSSPSSIPQAARAGSPLTAAAMRKSDGGLDLRLYFLDRDNRLAWAQCDTLRPLADKEPSCWEMGGRFPSYSEQDSQLAVTNIVWTTMKVSPPCPMH